jgi:phosphopantetheinyl transferase (holo-ACP synthase)
MVETLTPPTANTPKYQADPRLLEARMKLAHHLGLPPDNVTITIGPKDKSAGSLDLGSSTPDAPTEEVHITIHKQGLDIEPDRLREELRTALAQVKPIADVAQMVPEVKLATKLATDLKEATKGTKFNQKLLEWPGFNPEMHKHGVTVNDYAIEDVRSKPYGIELNLRFPSENRGDQADTMQKFSEVTKGRIEAIREILVERVVKYDRENLTKRGLNAEEISHVTEAAKAEGKNEEQIKEALAAKLEANIKASEAQVREQFTKLQFNVSTHNSRITVSIRSPEQAAAYTEAEKSDRGFRDPENADALRNSNPLTSLTVGLTRDSTPATDTTPEISPQLHKALARSILFDKNKNPIPDFEQIAGRKDIQIAIAKEMMRVLPEHPEREAQFRAMLSSNIFKQHELWHGSSIGQADTAKPYPRFEKVVGENDTVDLTLTVRRDADPAKNQLKHLIEGLANHTTPSVAPAPVAVAPTPAAEQPKAETPAVAAAPAPVAVQQPQPQAPAEAPAAPANVYQNIARDIMNLQAQRQPQPGQNWVDRSKPATDQSQSWGDNVRQQKENGQGPSIEGR